ncbi:MAG: cupin domain-containing protein, partial [Chloroflexota bacterium]
ILLSTAFDAQTKLHKLPTAEIYHYHLGDPVLLLLLYPDGTTGRITLGPDVLAGHEVQVVVPPDVWQAVSLLPAPDGIDEAYTLFGTTMAPGFTPDDYLGADRAELLEKYPHEADLITQLTDPNSPRHMQRGDDR